MLYFVREAYPTFRPDVDTLFFDELLSRGHRIDFVMQSAKGDSDEDVHLIETGRVLLGKTDVGRGVWHKTRRVVLAFAHDIRSSIRMRAKDYDCVQFKDKFLSAAIGIAIARTKRMKVFFWLSFPFPESRQAGAKPRTIKSLPLYGRGVVEDILLYRYILPRCAHVFVQSAQMSRDLQARGVPPAKMTVVPMGVDLAQFKIGPAQRESAAADAPTIGYLGTLGAERQLVVLIDMLGCLRKDFGLRANLLLVGEGNGPEDRRILQRRAAELGVEQFVRITGFLPRERALAELNAADVCISPFYPTPILLSTSPTKLVEYMALGKPVVANDHPEQSLIIEQSNAGACVPWGASSFAEAIARIMQMPPAEQRALGHRGRRWVEENRTYTKIANDLEQRYVSLLK